MGKKTWNEIVSELSTAIVEDLYIFVKLDVLYHEEWGAE